MQAVSSSWLSEAAVPETSLIASKINGLDLEPIIFRLVRGEPMVMSLEEARFAEIRYRRFLFLHLKYPHEELVPSDEIDTIWHTHILDTRKYFADTLDIFGKYLHHFPYFGLRGKEDYAAMTAAYERTTRLYSIEFPETAIGYKNKTGASVCGKCKSVGTNRPTLPKGGYRFAGAAA